MRRALLALVAAILPASAGAQQVQVQAPKPPHYLATPLDIRVVATGFAEDPTPRIHVEPPPGGHLQLMDVTPNVSTRIAIVNRELTQTREVSFVYDFRYLPEAPGDVTIGPFRVVQGATERTAGAVSLQIREVPLSDRVRVQLVLPEEPVYVGQRIEARLEFWLEAELQKGLENYSLRVPLFEQSKRFRLLDGPEIEPGVDVTVQTAIGPRQFRGTLEHRRYDGRLYNVYVVPVRLIPLREGTTEMAPATLVVSEATRWRRDFFGGRRAARVRKLRGSDRPLRLEVRTLPSEGRPESFAGAVGSGYSLEVSADRSVVQVGDPIELTITLRGGGDLEAAALPPLDAKGLLPPSQFRVPPGDLTGRVEDGAKRFTAVVRVLDEGVREVPALTYAWFDTESERYETTRSRPIALSVRSGEVIGAAQVQIDSGPEPALATREEPVPIARSFALTGADLAIERDPRVLARDAGRALGGVWLPAGLYGGSVLAVALAAFARRRRDVDPTLRARRTLVARELESIRAAASLPGDEAAGRIAGALRRLLASMPDARSEELDALLGACDAHSYAPPDASGRAAAPLPAELLARAERLAQSLQERVG